jgi:hypothetical protein
MPCRAGGVGWRREQGTTAVVGSWKAPARLRRLAEEAVGSRAGRQQRREKGKARVVGEREGPDGGRE